MTDIDSPHVHTESIRKSTYQLLDRTVAILELFSGNTPEWSASHIARTLELPVPSVHRILVALAVHGYISQDSDTRRFRLGPAAVRLGDRANASMDLRSLCRPILRQLSRDTSETALLTIPDDQGSRSICLERVETVEPLRLSVAPGRELPLHAGASQKALAAFLDDTTRERLLEQPLERLCSRTITEPADLREDFHRIKSLGWASSVEETNDGAWGIAVPVIGSAGVICAVGIAGPVVRLHRERVPELVRRVHGAARFIADALGARAPDVRITKSQVRQLTTRRQHDTR